MLWVFETENGRICQIVRKVNINIGTIATTKIAISYFVIPVKRQTVCMRLSTISPEFCPRNEAFME